MWSKLNLFVTVGLLSVGTTGCARPKYPTSGAHTTVDTFDANDTCAIEFSPSKNCLSWRWLTPPAYKQFGTMLIKIGRANAFDRTVIPADASQPLTIAIDMPSMHHGTLDPVIERLDTGTYKISQIFLSMQGHWEIRVQLRDGEHLVDEALVPYDFTF